MIVLPVLIHLPFKLFPGGAIMNGGVINIIVCISATHVQAFPLGMYLGLKLVLW